MDPLWPSEALICTSRPFGAGFGIGTVCAGEGVVTQVAIEVAIKSANPDRAIGNEKNLTIGDS